MSSMDDSDNMKIIDSMALNGPIEDMLKESIRQDDLEFEFVYGELHGPTKNPLTKELFIDLKHKLDGSTNYTTLDETNSLDIRCEFSYNWLRLCWITACCCFR